MKHDFPVTEFDGDHLLAACIRSGQASAGQVHQHAAAGELPVQMLGPEPTIEGGNFTVLPNATAALARRLADIGATVLLETTAVRVVSSHATQLFDSQAVDEEEMPEGKTLEAMQRDLADAVKWMDERGLLVRPIAGNPRYVAVK